MKNIITLTPSVKPMGDPDYTGTHVMRTRDGRVVSSHFVFGTVNMTIGRFERFRLSHRLDVAERLRDSGARPMNAPAIVKREWKVQTADTVYEVVELQTVAIGKRTRKREVYCGYFSTFEAAKDYIRFTFADTPDHPLCVQIDNVYRAPRNAR